MNRFFKTFVLGLCSLSLFSCSNSHELGNDPYEPHIIDKNELSFEQFKEVAFSTKEYVENLPNILDGVWIYYKQYQEWELIEDLTIHGNVVNGVLEYDNNETQASLVSLIFSMPNFVDIYEKGKLEAEYTENVHFYRMENSGGYRAFSPNMDFQWSKNGLLVFGEAKSHNSDGYEIEINFSTSYIFKEN